MNRVKKIEIKPIDARPARSQFELTLYDPSRVLLVNMIPEDLSDESGQDSEPCLAVHLDGQLMVGAAYTHTPDSRRRKTSPLYLSTDGGLTWVRQFKIPATRIYSQSYCFSGTDQKLYGVIAGGLSYKDQVTISVLETDDPISKAQMRVISKLGKGGFADQAFIQARGFDQDRIYVGHNYFGPELGAGKTASIRVSTNSGKTFRLFGLEARSTMGQDGPSVRPSVANDGTIYAAFYGWRASTGSLPNLVITSADLVVVRDDEGAIGDRPFRSLVDPTDRKPGRIVTQGLRIPFNARLGQQRIGSDLSLAVDPNNSATVYLAWADDNPLSKTYTIHVRRSIDRGLNWSKDLLAISSGTNPALAVSRDGIVGFLYQQLRDAGGAQERWETHFQSSANGSSGWGDILLASFPTKEPTRVYDPYLGNYIHLLSIGNNFYGIFLAPNIPERKYFPQGVRFQRRHKNGKLLSLDGKTKVDFSIDPYFFCVRAESESAVPQKVDALLAEIRGPALANYSGFVTAAFFNKVGRAVQEVGVGEACELRVQFGPRKPKESWAERIDISGGEDAPKLAFRISVDAGDDEVAPETKTVAVAPGGAATAAFQMVASKPVGSHTFFIQVFQKTRLIQIIAPTLIVSGRKKK